MFILTCDLFTQLCEDDEESDIGVLNEANATIGTKSIREIQSNIENGDKQVNYPQISDTNTTKPFSGM